METPRIRSKCPFRQIKNPHKGSSKRDFGGLDFLESPPVLHFVHKGWICVCKSWQWLFCAILDGRQLIGRRFKGGSEESRVIIAESSEDFVALREERVSSVEER